MESDADGRQYTGTWQKYLLPKCLSKGKLRRMSLNGYVWTFFKICKNIYLSNFNESKLKKLARDTK